MLGLVTHPLLEHMIFSCTLIFIFFGCHLVVLLSHHFLSRLLSSSLFLRFLCLPLTTSTYTNPLLLPHITQQRDHRNNNHHHNNNRRCLLGTGPPDIPTGLPITKDLPKPSTLSSPLATHASPKSARSPKHSPHPTLTSPPTAGMGAPFASPGGQTQFTQFTFGTMGGMEGGQAYQLGEFLGYPSSRPLPRDPFHSPTPPPPH